MVLLAVGGAADWVSAQDAVDNMVRSFITRRKIPSAAIAVVKDGRIVRSAGYGIANLETGSLATDTAVYEIGSISKSFAAQAIMLLVEEGKLRLDDSLTRWIDGVPAAWAGITVRHVLHHTAGFKDWDGGPDFSYRRAYTPAEFIEIVARYPLQFLPGDRFAYTSSGYPLLGLVVQRAAGEPYESFVARRIFVPAGMTGTRFKHAQDVVRNRAGGYVDSAGVFQNGEPHRPGIIAPSGGVMSTAQDMARWMIALEAGRLVKPATLDLMQTPVRLNDGRTFSAGMGWFLDTFHGHRLLLHNGSTVGGYSSVVYRYPDDRLAVVVLFNVDRFNAVNLLATRLVSLFGPPLWTGGFAERPDPDPGLSRRVLEMLRAVAERRDTEMLAPNLRNPGAPPRTNATFGFAGTPDRFAFLDREDLGSAGQVRFGNTIRAIHRYKLVAGERTLYYSVEFTPEGKVARFVMEED